MYLPNQSRPVQRKRSYSIGNKVSSIRMSDDMEGGDDDETEGGDDDDMESGDDDEGGGEE